MHFLDTITDSKEEENEDEPEEDSELPESWEEHHDEIVDKKEVRLFVDLLSLSILSCL